MTDPTLLERILALPLNAGIVFYYEMKQQEDAPNFYGKSEFFKADLENILTLGKGAAQLGAREIAQSWPSTWSSTTVATDIDRLEIGVLGDGSDPSIQFISFIGGTDLRVESECIPFQVALAAVEQALQNGQTDVLISPSEGDIQDAYDDFESMAQGERSRLFPSHS